MNGGVWAVLVGSGTYGLHECLKGGKLLRRARVDRAVQSDGRPSRKEDIHDPWLVQLLLKVYETYHLRTLVNTQLGMVFQRPSPCYHGEEAHVWYTFNRGNSGMTMMCAATSCLLLCKIPIDPLHPFLTFPLWRIANDRPFDHSPRNARFADGRNMWYSMCW